MCLTEYNEEATLNAIREEGVEEGLEIGIQKGREEGVSLSVQIFKLIQSGIDDNRVIAAQCKCTEQKVDDIRKQFGI